MKRACERVEAEAQDTHRNKHTHTVRHQRQLTDVAEFLKSLGNGAATLIHSMAALREKRSIKSQI